MRNFTFINSSAVVSAIQSSIAEIESSLNCTVTALQQVEEVIPRVEQLIAQTEDNVQEVCQWANVSRILLHRALQSSLVS